LLDLSKTLILWLNSSIIAWRSSSYTFDDGSLGSVDCFVGSVDCCVGFDDGSLGSVDCFVGSVDCCVGSCYSVCSCGTGLVSDFYSSSPPSSTYISSSF